LLRVVCRRRKFMNVNWQDIKKAKVVLYDVLITRQIDFHAR
jgi:hypothetical protein